MPRPVNLTGYAIVVAPSVANRCSYTRGKDSGDLKKLAGLNCRNPTVLKAPNSILEIEFLSHSTREISQ
jgi:hypothetical protein